MDTYRIELWKLGIAVCSGIVCGNVVSGIHPGFPVAFIASVVVTIITFTLMDRING